MSSLDIICSLVIWSFVDKQIKQMVSELGLTWLKVIIGLKVCNVNILK